MRSLKSFLLEEIVLSESKKEGPIEGYLRFEQRGPLTNQLQDLLGISSAKEMKLDNELLKTNTQEGRASIVKDLNLGGSKDFNTVFAKIAKASKMSPVFTGYSQKVSIENAEGIKFQLTSNFKELAGTPTATLKFIKFWCSCACIAAGQKKSDVEKYKYFFNAAEKMVLVTK
tara:strand:+ start:9796 stop:10311 length:516 start_codon:yes stop_codon:yes gene_type:complete